VTTDTATDLEYETREGGVVRLIIRGRLDAERVGSLRTQIAGKLVGSKPPSVKVDAPHVEGCDGFGIALPQKLKVWQEDAQNGFRIEGLP